MLTAHRARSRHQIEPSTPELCVIFMLASLGPHVTLLFTSPGPYMRDPCLPGLLHVGV